MLTIKFNIEVGYQLGGFIGCFNDDVETLNYELTSSFNDEDGYLDCEEIELLINQQLNNNAQVVDGDSSMDRDYFSLLLEDDNNYYNVTIIEIN